MDVSQTIKTNSSEGLIVTDLSDNIANQKYHFYLLDISKNCSIFLTMSFLALYALRAANFSKWKEH